MSYGRENAAWAGCGGPTVRDQTFRQDGWTLVADTAGLLYPEAVRAGDTRRCGELWFATEAAARQWMAETYPDLYRRT